MRSRRLDDPPNQHLAAIRQHLEASPKSGIVEGRCEGKQCHLLLDQDAVAVSCDGSHIFENYQGKRPDFFLASVRPKTNHVCLVVIEMKSGGMELSKLQQQLQRGADRIVEAEIPLPSGSDFVPLVLRGKSGLRTADRLILDQKKVSFLGVKRTILIERCGSSLSQIL